MATLFVVATPIGNMEDISIRALRVLGEADVLACEDTRHTRKIFEANKIPSPRTIFSYHEHNEEFAGKRILGFLESGQNVALCSDGGCPAISDPGYRVIAACRENGHNVEVIPGPSAVSTALLASGLSTASFTFKGFGPRKPGPRKRWLGQERDLPHTIIVFESPFRLAALLADAHEALGNRLAAVCLELTKKFEDVRRGYLDELAQFYKSKSAPKGEITVVIAGNNAKFTKAESPEEDREEDADPDEEEVDDTAPEEEDSEAGDR